MLCETRRTLHSRSESKSEDDDEPSTRKSMKRQFRNESEKRRRDQFNQLIGELSLIIGDQQKLDKSSILKE
ncbi:unnamed protein product, partial [Didymodactylos carnosus]